MNVREMVKESLRIEGIIRDPEMLEMEAFNTFMGLEEVTIEDLENFVKIYQPNARLRANTGDNVMVGKHMAPAGGINIVYELQELLHGEAYISKQPGNIDSNAFHVHHAYETLHPFTDCNGRSGRMLWYWMMGGTGKHLGFLHTWYYQSLEFRRNE